MDKLPFWRRNFEESGKYPWSRRVPPLCTFPRIKNQNKNPGDLNGCTPLHDAAFKGDMEICEFIASFLPENDKNPGDKYKHTPLHRAASLGRFEICKLIIEQAMDKNPKDAFAQTPLHDAARMGHLEVCKFFISTFSYL